MYWYNNYFRHFIKSTMGLMHFSSIMHFIIYLVLIHQLNEYSSVNKSNESNENDVNLYGKINQMVLVKYPNHFKL